MSLMEEWHRGDDYFRSEIHDPENDWLELYENHDKFIEMTKACEAPLELRELIWTAMQSTRDAFDESDGSSTLRDRMSDILKNGSNA